MNRATRTFSRRTFDIVTNKMAKRKATAEYELVVSKRDEAEVISLSLFPMVTAQPTESIDFTKDFPNAIIRDIVQQTPSPNMGRFVRDGNIH